MDHDFGGFEDLTDDGIASFLAENLGEIDQEFIEEFRSSDLFDEFVKQLNPPLNHFTTPPGSRRSSTVDIVVEANTSVNNNDGKTEVHRDEELAGPSTSKSLARNTNSSDYSSNRKNKTQSTKSSIDLRSDERQPKKTKSPTKSSNLRTDEHQPKKVPAPKKGADFKSETTVESRMHSNEQTPKKNKSLTKSCSSSWKNEAGKSNLSSERKLEKREAHKKNRVVGNLTLAKPNLRLCDLLLMKNLFPTGMSHVVVTPRLLEEIRNLERDILSTEACKKLIKKSNQTPVNKSTEKRPVQSSDDKLKQTGMVGSGSKKSSSSKDFSTKISQVLDNVQLYQNKERIENKTPLNSELSRRKEKKTNIDESSKMSPVDSYSKSSNHATKTDHYTDESKSSRKGKTKADHSRSAEATEVKKRDQTNRHPKSSVQDKVLLEKKNEPKYLDKQTASKSGLSMNVEKLNRKHVVNLHVPLFGIVKKKDMSYKETNKVECKDQSVVHEKPESSSLECAGSADVGEKVVLPPHPVHLESESSSTLECPPIKDVDGIAETLQACKSELEGPPPLDIQGTKDVVEEELESPEVVQADVEISPLEVECQGSKDINETNESAHAIQGVQVDAEISPQEVECQGSKDIGETNESVHAIRGVKVDAEISPLEVECQGSKDIDKTNESPQAVHMKQESSSSLECEGSKNVDEEMETLQAAQAESEIASPMECRESMDTGDNLKLTSNAHAEPGSSPALECPEKMEVEEVAAAASSPAVGSNVVNEAIETEFSTFEADTDLQHLSPDDASDVQNSGSPEETIRRKSPERPTYKRKNVIESSSDDENKRIDAADDMDPDSEQKRSSDEEQLRKSLAFERKRDPVDSRSKKFDKFENERLRKLGEKKKGKEKPKESVALEDVLKEKPLIGSFRIPKKTTGTTRRLPKSALTPLASADVPKESMQFERCRKTTEKDKREYGDFNNRRRDNNREDYIDVSGTNFANRRKKEYEPEHHFREWSRDKDKDDERVVLLAPDSKKQDEAPPSPSSPPRSPEIADTEPQWCNDGKDIGGASSSSSSADDANYYPTADDLSKRKPMTPNIEINEESMTEEALPTIDPEVPIDSPQGNIITSGVLYFLSAGEKIDLPDVKSMETKDATVMKLAWWFSKIDPENVAGVDSSDSECDDTTDEKGASNRNFLSKLEFTETDDEELFPCDSTDPRRKPYLGLVGEVCGRSLLVAKYRSGPGDKFENIFILRSGASYEKENFQARCTLCDCLVVGKFQLADHVCSDDHKLKMSKAGLGNVNGDNECSDNKHNKNGKEKVRSDKISESEDKKSTNSKDREIVKISRSRTTDESRGKKKDEGEKKKESKSDKHDSSEKRKHSKDNASNDESRKSKDDADKPDAKTDRRHSRSRGNRSRSRSPRHKRTRTRSPRRRTRSPRGHRRRSRSIQKVERIPRSPSKLREEKRRSTSAERVQKFLAKTNQTPRRRSRSPSKGYSRKRHRRSRSKSPIGVNAHPNPKADNREFHEKLALQADGKWTNVHEQQWKLMEADLAIFKEQYGERKQTLNDSPERHPIYGDEWTAFWEKRYSEVQKEGLDADEYDYIPEWKEYWTKRLRDLLDVEYETTVNDIKEKYSMDLDSLKKIRLPTISLKMEEIGPLQPSAMSTPQDLATPSTPSSIAPAPSIHVSVPQLNVTKSMCSNTSANGEDYTTRSMSISDGGDVDNRSDRGIASTKGVTTSTPAPTAVDIMSHWEKLRSGELVQQPKPSNSSTHRSKNADNMSNQDSGSIASLDFDGFDLTQVLRGMSTLEDQLSFMAEKVKEYFKKAEELDLRKKNKSYQLLEDEDFVVMLFNVRDRFTAMIRSKVLKKDVLKTLNYTVFALNTILEAPQCQKHHAKITNTAVVLEKERNESDLPKIVNTKPTEKSSSPPVRRKDPHPLLNIPSFTKGKIALLVAEFLQNMGREDLSDAELRELLKKLLPSTHKGESEAVATDGDKSKSQQSSTQPQRNAEGSSISHGIDPWHPNEVRTKTSVVTTRATGNAAPLPSLPDVIVPMPAPVHDRGPLGCREDVWNNTITRGHDSNVSSSDSELRAQSPFSRRDFRGNPTANAFRDKGTLNAHSLAETELDNHYRISAIDDALPNRHSHGIGLERREIEPEIMLGQVTKSRRNSVQSSAEGSPYPVNNIRLVSGINNIIMKEKSSKNQPQKKDPHPSSDDDKYARRERPRYKKKRKRKHKRERRHRSSSSNTSYSSTSERERRLKREKYRRRKDENSGRRKVPVAPPEVSIISTDSSIKSVQNYHRGDFKTGDSASLRESNSRRTSGQNFNEASPAAYRTEAAAYQHQPKQRHSVRINIPTTFKSANWDALSDISSIGDANKQARLEKHAATSLCDKTDKAQAVDSKEILSVSKAFWTEDVEEIEIPLSSVSSNELKEPEKGERQYKIREDSLNKEKEPGEITDSSGS